MGLGRLLSSIVALATNPKERRRVLYRMLKQFNVSTVRCLVNGHPLIVNLQDPTLGEILFVEREFERFELEFILKNIQPGMSILVIGANIGLHVVPLAKRAETTGKVIAFEPDLTNVDFLRRNVNLHQLRNVTVEPLAVSSSESELTLYKSTVNLGNHRTYHPIDSDRFNQGREYQEVKVQAVTIDEYCQRNNLHPQCILMDIEGSEYQALLGMERTLREFDGIMIFELCPYFLEQSGSSGELLLEKLDSWGFEFLYIDEAARAVSVVKKEDVMQLILPFGLINLAAVKRGSSSRWVN